MTLSGYVGKTNGVPLGDSRSLSRMLARSLGAGSIMEFWHYWNPIWGFYLSTYVFAPLKKRTRPASAFLLTFAVSGAVHDVAVTLISREVHLLYSLYFTVLGAEALIAKKIALRYHGLALVVRIAINLAYLTSNYLVVRYLYRVILSLVFDGG